MTSEGSFFNLTIVVIDTIKKSNPHAKKVPRYYCKDQSGGRQERGRGEGGGGADKVLAKFEGGGGGAHKVLG